jgi:hypothetical protein
MCQQYSWAQGKAMSDDKSCQQTQFDLTNGFVAQISREDARSSKKNETINSQSENTSVETLTRLRKTSETKANVKQSDLFIIERQIENLTVRTS